MLPFLLIGLAVIVIVVVIVIVIVMVAIAINVVATTCSRSVVWGGCSMAIAERRCRGQRRMGRWRRMGSGRCRFRRIFLLDSNHAESIA